MAVTMRVLILTAGCSRRLRPLTDTTPKCLLTVGGLPILRRSVDNLLSLGVNELTVVTGYLDHMVRDALATWYPDLEIRYFHNPDYATTNNAYSLLAARPEMDGEAFFLLDGDIIYDTGILKGLLDHGPDCLALRTQGHIGLEEVKVEVTGGHQVQAIGKEIAVPRAAGESVGIEYFSARSSRELFRTLHKRVIEQGLHNEYYEASFQEMIAEGGVSLRAIPIEPHYAIEIDTRADLAAANDILLGRRAATDSAAV